MGTEMEIFVGGLLAVCLVCLCVSMVGLVFMCRDLSKREFERDVEENMRNAED
jgi:hypothetical protein